MDSERPPTNRFRPTIEGYLRYKFEAETSRRKSTFADLLCGVPLFSGLAVAFTVSLWRGLQTGEILAGRGDKTLASESLIWFGTSVAMHILLIALCCFFVVSTIRAHWRRFLNRE